MNDLAYTHHNQAMDIAEEAIIKKRILKPDEVKRLFEKAYRLEKEAALSLKDHPEEEPDRSVLFRSAASLAFNAGLLRDAEIMVNYGLAGNPPEEIAGELRDLYQSINFSHHLKNSDVILGDDEYQLVIAGPAIGHGYLRYDEFTKRLNTINTLVARTARRLDNAPFSKSLRDDNLNNNFKLFLCSGFQAASFSAVFRLSEPVQPYLSHDLNPGKKIVDDILKNISLLNDCKEQLLRENIKDEDYYRNFLVLSRELAPDGANVDLVGLSSKKASGDFKVNFSRRRDAIDPEKGSYTTTDATKDEGTIVEITGILNYADAKSKCLKLTDDNNKRWIVEPSDWIRDIVKSYWEEQVRIKGHKTGDKKVKLIRIDRVDD